MAKKATDLLDVFRLGSAEGGTDRRTGTSRKSKASGKRPASKRPASSSSFEGVFLAPRQLMLLSCVIVLLVVLSFMAGLGLSRGGASSSDALSRETPAPGGWFIRGTLPLQDPFTERVVAPQGLRTELARRGLGPRWVTVREIGREQLEILVGPFEDRDRAKAYLKEIELMEVSGGRLFRFATVTQQPRR